MNLGDLVLIDTTGRSDYDGLFGLVISNPHSTMDSYFKVFIPGVGIRFYFRHHMKVIGETR
jgi:hypothetical protein